MISEDGSYRVTVDRTDSYIIELSRKKEAWNHLLKYTIGTDQHAAKVASTRVTLSESNEMASFTLSPRAAN